MALAQALTDTDWGVRSICCVGIRKIKPKSLKVLSFITELLKNHEKSYVRSRCCEGIRTDKAFK